MNTLTFDASVKTTERTETITGLVIASQDYTVEIAGRKVSGIELRLKNMPHSVRLLKGSITGAFKASEIHGATVTITGIMEPYKGTNPRHKGKTYFKPMDCNVDEMGKFAAISAQGGGGFNIS